MKLRRENSDITDKHEHELVESVRGLAGEKPLTDTHGPTDAYFASLIVKTNEKIDYVTSGRALSISWLARVAVPGVVAILFFFIGLHYYVPAPARKSTTIADAVKALPSDQLDSLLLSSSLNGRSQAEWYPDMFSVKNEYLVEYFVASEHPATVLETLSDQQLKEVAAILESKSTSL